MNSYVVGIDVGEEKSDACYLSPASDILGQFTFQITRTGWSDLASIQLPTPLHVISDVRSYSDSPLIFEPDFAL